MLAKTNEITLVQCDRVCGPSFFFRFFKFLQKMNRSLDELSASELNAAIDDTNFPKLQNAVVYGAMLPPSSDDAVATAKNGTSEDDQMSDTPNTSSEAPNLTSSHSNGISDGSIIKRVHPAPLKMVSFKGDSFDVPGTPRTPRTSTTPGKK